MCVEWVVFPYKESPCSARIWDAPRGMNEWMNEWMRAVQLENVCFGDTKHDASNISEQFNQGSNQFQTHCDPIMMKMKLPADCVSTWTVLIYKIWYTITIVPQHLSLRTVQFVVYFPGHFWRGWVSELNRLALSVECTSWGSSGISSDHFSTINLWDVQTFLWGACLAESEYDTLLPIMDSYDKSSFLAMFIMIYHCLQW